MDNKLPRRSLFAALLSLVAVFKPRSGLALSVPSFYVPPHYVLLTKEDHKKLTEEIEQLRVQLAGCSVAALGYDHDTKRGDYGWSASFDDVKSLYQKYQVLRGVVPPGFTRVECSVTESLISDFTRVITVVRQMS
jgi:hypothetical protein